MTQGPSEVRKLILVITIKEVFEFTMLCLMYWNVRARRNWPEYFSLEIGTEAETARQIFELRQGEENGFNIAGLRQPFAEVCVASIH